MGTRHRWQGGRYATNIAREPLGPLIAHDNDHGTPMRATTRAFLECGGHRARTAERCSIAASTLEYRLGKIEQPLGNRRLPSA